MFVNYTSVQIKIQRKRRRKYKNGKEETKLLLFADDMIIQIEKPNLSTDKLLKLRRDFNKFPGYDKVLCILKINNNHLEKVILKNTTL